MERVLERSGWRTPPHGRCLSSGVCSVCASCAGGDFVLLWACSGWFGPGSGRLGASRPRLKSPKQDNATRPRDDGWGVSSRLNHQGGNEGRE
jgi:hypothetical protein